MSFKKIKNLLLVGLATTLTLGLAQSATAQVTNALFDNFNNGAVLKESFWQPTSVGWGNGVQEANRRIVGRKLNLQIRSTALPA